MVSFSLSCSFTFQLVQLSSLSLSFQLIALFFLKTKLLALLLLFVSTSPFLTILINFHSGGQPCCVQFNKIK